MTDETESENKPSTREQRLRIVEALMPGFWAVARPGSQVKGLLHELDEYVIGGVD